MDYTLWKTPEKHIMAKLKLTAEYEAETNTNAKKASVDV